MKSDTSIILSHLETGLSADIAHLRAFETQLSETLRYAALLSERQGASEQWNNDWRQQCEAIDKNLERIRGSIEEMDHCIKGGTEDRLTCAFRNWQALQAQDAELVESINTVRSLAADFPEDLRNDWQLLSGTLDSYLEVVHACTRALRVKLDLLQRMEAPSATLSSVDQAEAPRLTKPKTSEVFTEEYARELARAARAIEEERYEIHGPQDVLRAMFMWIEAPAERVRREKAHAGNAAPSVEKRAG
jgi:chromosome segregation ATPase